MKILGRELYDGEEPSPICPCCGCTDKIEPRLIRADHPVPKNMLHMDGGKPEYDHFRCNCCSFQGSKRDFYLYVDGGEP